MVGYNYELQAGGCPLLAWHWHPVGRSPITWPQLHLHGGSGAVDLSKAHLAMGTVTLPAILRGAIMDLGVVPRRCDWLTVLEQAIADLEMAPPS